MDSNNEGKPLLAPVVHKSLEVLLLEQEIDSLKKALLFYAHPEQHYLGGRWMDCICGVEYEYGGRVFCDTGEIARITLERCSVPKEVRNGEGS